MHLQIKNNSETTYTLFTLAKKSKLLNNDKVVVTFKSLDWTSFTRPINFTFYFSN